MMRINHIISSIIIAILLSGFTVIKGEGGPHSPLDIVPEDDPELPECGYYRGVQANPYPGQTFDEVHENVSLHSQFIPVWGRPSPFYNLSEDLSGPWGDIFVKDLIRGNGMFPLIHMNFFGRNMTLQTPDSMSSPTLNDTDWRELYIKSAKDIVNASKPKFFSIGNEVNRWYEEYGANPSDKNGFQHFVSLYNETYDAVKALSPDTVVFCTFSREIVSKNKEANMSFLKMFDPDRLDLLVLTTYPYSVQGINRVSDIPDNYYSGVFDHTDIKKIGFSEAAWTSLSQFGGEEEQSAFIRNITGRLTEGLDLELLGWPWLHDIGPADRTGLRYNDGTPKSSLKTWKNNTEPTYDRNNRTIELDEDFGTYLYELNRTFSDPDPGDSLTYKIWNGTEYTNFSDEGKLNASIDGNLLVLTSYENMSGNVQVRIRAEDRMKDSNWTFFLITVNEINDLPVVTGPIEVYEDVESMVPVSSFITDAETPVILLNITILSSPILEAEIGFTTTSVLFLTPPKEWYGQTNITIRVKDMDGGDVVFDLNVTVIPVEDPPLLDVPSSLEMDEDSTIYIDVTGWWTDTDPLDELTVTVNSSVDDLEIHLEQDNLTITSQNDWHGSALLNVKVSDGKVDSKTTIDLIVNPINDPPEYRQPGIINMTEDVDLYFDLNEIYPFDREGESIIYTFERSSDVIRSVVFFDNDTMKVSPRLNSHGEGNFTISMRDPSGGLTHVKFDVMIESVNDPPYLFTPSNWTIHIRRGETHYIDISSYPYVSEDVDDPIETVSLRTDSDWCTGNSSTLIISIPTDTQTEMEEVRFWLSDGIAISEKRNLTIHILDPIVNDTDPELRDLNLNMEGKSLIITLEGEPDLDLWLILTYPSGTRNSYQLTEDINSRGNYYLRIDEPDLQKGDNFTIHVSLTENGDSVSGLPPIESTYVYEEPEQEEEDEEEGLPVLFIIIGIVALLAIMAVIFLLARKKTPEEE
jgi:hypothetical protein